MALGWLQHRLDVADGQRQLHPAIDETLNLDKMRTGDLGGTAGTVAFTQALVSRIKNG